MSFLLAVQEIHIELSQQMNVPEYLVLMELSAVKQKFQTS